MLKLFTVGIRVLIFVQDHCVQPESALRPMTQEIAPVPTVTNLAENLATISVILPAMEPRRALSGQEFEFGQQFGPMDAGQRRQVLTGRPKRVNLAPRSHQRTGRAATMGVPADVAVTNEKPT